MSILFFFRGELHVEEMAVNISGLRRNIKNVAHNYTDAQVNIMSYVFVYYLKLYFLKKSEIFL